MIPATCKRLIEVDFPIAKVSEHSAREKSIRHGHPSTLHLWWARRPLAACRAVLMDVESQAKKMDMTELRQGLKELDKKQKHILAIIEGKAPAVEEGEIIK